MYSDFRDGRLLHGQINPDSKILSPGNILLWLGSPGELILDVKDGKLMLETWTWESVWPLKHGFGMEKNLYLFQAAAFISD